MTEPIIFLVPGQGTPGPDRAIIYVPQNDIEESTLACLQYAYNAGYEVQGVIVGRWDDALNMALDGAADVLVVASRDHIPGAVVPRIEVVEDRPRRSRGDKDDAEPPPVPRQRRPNLLDE